MQTMSQVLTSSGFPSIETPMQAMRHSMCSGWGVGNIDRIAAPATAYVQPQGLVEAMLQAAAQRQGN